MKTKPPQKRTIRSNVKSEMDNSDDLTIYSSTGEVVHLGLSEAQYLSDQLGRWLHDRMLRKVPQHKLEMIFEEPE